MQGSRHSMQLIRKAAVESDTERDILWVCPFAWATGVAMLPLLLVVDDQYVQS